MHNNFVHEVVNVSLSDKVAYPEADESWNMEILKDITDTKTNFVCVTAKYRTTSTEHLND